MNKLENRGKLPSQPDVNPRQNASAIALRSRKEIPSSDATSLQQDHAEATATEPENSKNSPNVSVVGNPEKPPFPHRLMKKKKSLDDQEVLATLKKVEINILLLTVIKQVSRYCKFLKELCTSINKLKGNERIFSGASEKDVCQGKRPRYVYYPL